MHLHSRCCSHPRRAVQGSLLQCNSSRPSSRAVRQVVHMPDAVSTSAADNVTEKEAMSQTYNEQMAKQMGWANPFEVG